MFTFCVNFFQDKTRSVAWVVWVVGALMERSTTDAEVFRKHMKDANRGEKLFSGQDKV
jgi:hypothetical protein